ncbi:hypothetical protein [Parabacteroides sp. PF5-9]|uniref:hypothetical protein n=1 Tax=Parabacteroides sp. PF5-9 TaxID=1742404 RepID=UPI002476F5B2|nr:hypothetical protein [Parabacteroides sp. PF5-9]
MNTKQKSRYPILLIAILLLTGTIPAMAERWENTKRKEVNNTFDVSLSDLLQIDNRYGNTTVTHWEQNKVSIRVVIESKARNEKRAQENLDRVQIELKKSGKTVSGITSIANKNWNGNGNNERLEINYFISMPSKLASDLSQRYGNIILPSRNEGKSKLTVKYGNIQGGDFTAPLTIDAQYGNVEIKDLETATIELGYVGNMTFGNANEVAVDSKYSTITGKNVDRVTVENKYGGLTLREVENISLDLKYGNAKLEKVRHTLNVEDLSYSGLEVKELSAGFSKASIEARYGNATLGISSNAKFNVKVEGMKYGNLTIKGHKSSVIQKDNSEEEHAINGGNRNKEIYFDGNNYSNLIIKSL